MEKADRKIKKIVKEYALEMPLYKDFAFSVKRITEEIIKKEGLEKHIQVVTAREKNIESLVKKLLNKRFKDNPDNLTYLEKKNIKKFSDVKDLAGVRVILYFKGDILKRLRMALQEEFDYSPRDEQKHKDADGQESIHSWITFNEKRLNLREYAKFKGLKCEIQLVTILQHAWSELEHDIVYKPHGGWDKSEIEKFDNMFKEAKEYIKKAADIFESIMYIHQNEDKFLLFDKFDDLDNNRLYEYLEKLRAYMEKNYLGNDVVLKDIVGKIEKIVIISSKNKVVKEKNIFGDLEGKTYRDILVKVLEILSDSRIKYSSKDNFQKIFELVIGWANLLESDNDKKEVYNFIENLSQYDLHVLKQIGLFNQKLIVDILEGWSDEYKAKNSKAINVIVKKILQPSFESRSMVEWNKLQFSNGSLVEDKKGNLKKIRRKAIDLIFDVYSLVKDNKEKFEIVKVLDEASRTPHSGASESLEKIIIDDANYLITKYQKIVFDKKGKIICDLPVAMEVERQLLWLKRRWSEEKIKGISSFIAILRKDKKYFAYSQLIDRSRLDFLEKEENKVEEVDLSKKIVANKQWLTILNDIAQASQTEEDWKFNDFHAFLTDLTEKDYKKGEYFLKDALKNNAALLNFSDAFLLGFRNIGKVNLWDMYVAEIEKKKDGNLLSKILHSFNFHFKNSKTVRFRKKDFSWLENISRRKGKFSFLLSDGYNKFNLDYILFRSIMLMWRYQQEESENLLINEIKRADINSLSQKIDEIELYSSWKDADNIDYLDIKKWKKENINFLSNCIIKSNRIDYAGEKLAIKLGEIDFKYFLKIIKGRLDLSDKPKKNSKNYDAIPTRIDENLVSFIEKNRGKFKRGMVSWIGKKRLEVFNYYECGSLLRSLGEIHSEIVMELVRKNNQDYFTKAVLLLRSFDGINLELAFEVADHLINSKNIATKEKDKLLEYIGGQMHSTGLVSGEHGVSEEHKKKAVDIAKIREEMLKNNKHKKLIKFADDTIKYLQEQAVRERIDEDRQFKMMEINFDN